MKYIKFFSGLLFLSCSTNNPLIENWVYQLQYAEPETVSKTGFDLIVMDYSRDGTEETKYSKADIDKIKNSGIIPISYISIGEAENYRFYWNDEWATNPPDWIGKENPDWKGNYKVKFWDKEWQNIVYQYLDEIIAQGFQGIYLDIIDGFEYWADSTNGEDTVLSEEEAAKKMMDFVIRISQYCRNRAGEDFYVFSQNGENIIEYDDGTYMNVISGVGIEDLFYNETEKETEEEIEYRLDFLEQFLKSDKVVLSVDYVDDGSGYSGQNKTRIDDYLKMCRKYGFIPYIAITDRNLDEINIIKGVQP